MMCGLKEFFGARFPGASEIDHLMALRGLVIYYSKRPGGLGPDATKQMSDAINQVTSVLRDNLRVDTTRQPPAPRELFEHYRDVVSDNWCWLSRLKNLR